MASHLRGAHAMKAEAAFPLIMSSRMARARARAQVVGAYARTTEGPSAAYWRASSTPSSVPVTIASKSDTSAKRQKLLWPNFECAATRIARRARCTAVFFTAATAGSEVVRPCSQRDRVRAEVGHVDHERAEHVDGPVVHRRQGATAHPAAEQQHRDGAAVRERLGGQQRRRHHREVLVGQAFRDEPRRESFVQIDGVGAVQQGGRLGRDAMLLREVDLAAVLHGRLECGRLQRDRAAVDPFEQPPTRQRIEIAADGFGGDIELVGEPIDVHPTPGPGELDDPALAGVGIHGVTLLVGYRPGSLLHLLGCLRPAQPFDVVGIDEHLGDLVQQRQMVLAGTGDSDRRTRRACPSSRSDRRSARTRCRCGGWRPWPRWCRAGWPGRCPCRWTPTSRARAWRRRRTDPPPGGHQQLAGLGDRVGCRSSRMPFSTIESSASTSASSVPPPRPVSGAAAVAAAPPRPRLPPWRVRSTPPAHPAHRPVGLLEQFDDLVVARATHEVVDRDWIADGVYWRARVGQIPVRDHQIVGVGQVRDGLVDDLDLLNPAFWIFLRSTEAPIADDPMPASQANTMLVIGPVSDLPDNIAGHAGLLALHAPPCRRWRRPGPARRSARSVFSSSEATVNDTAAAPSTDERHTQEAAAGGLRVDRDDRTGRRGRAQAGAEQHVDEHARHAAENGRRRSASASSAHTGSRSRGCRRRTG